MIILAILIESERFPLLIKWKAVGIAVLCFQILFEFVIIQK